MSGSRTSGSSRPSLGVHVLAVFSFIPGKTAGSPRHPSSRHPRSSKLRFLGYSALSHATGNTKVAALKVYKNLCPNAEVPGITLQPPTHTSCKGLGLSAWARLFEAICFLPALQKTFVKLFYRFVWGFGIEKWRGSMMNFQCFSISREKSTNCPQKFPGDLAPRNSGRKYSEFGTLLLCNFSDLTFLAYRWLSASRFVRNRKRA